MRTILKISIVIILVLLIFQNSSCTRVVDEKITEFDYQGTRVLINLEGNSTLSQEQFDEISADVSEITEVLHPVDGKVLGDFNINYSGGAVPTSPVTEIIEQALKSSYETYGAFDPTLQILWDVYDFELDGRFVSEGELADALQWVDYTKVEFLDDEILKSDENYRFGLGPTSTGALIDIFAQEFQVWNIDLDWISIGGTGDGAAAVACLNSDEENPFVFDVVYPVVRISEDLMQPVFGHIQLESGEFVAVIDDDRKAFFAHGNRYHMVLDPLTGKPTDEIREVVVVSKISCMHASTMAYAVMVMGKIRGLEYIEENAEIEGVMVLDEGVVHVSGGLEDRFWR